MCLAVFQLGIWCTDGNPWMPPQVRTHSSLFRSKEDLGCSPSTFWVIPGAAGFSHMLPSAEKLNQD